MHFMDRTPDVSDFNYEEEGGDYGENDDNGNDVYYESMLPALHSMDFTRCFSVFFVRQICKHFSDDDCRSSLLSGHFVRVKTK